jgi:hypothetical protein
MLTHMTTSDTSDVDSRRPVRNPIVEVDHIDWTYAASASKSAAFRPEA